MEMNFFNSPQAVVMPFNDMKVKHVDEYSKIKKASVGIFDNKKKIKVYHSSIYFFDSPEGIYYHCINCDKEYSEKNYNCFTNNKYKILHVCGLQESIVNMYSDLWICKNCDSNFYSLAFIKNCLPCANTIIAHYDLIYAAGSVLTSYKKF